MWPLQPIGPSQPMKSPEHTHTHRVAGTAGSRRLMGMSGALAIAGARGLATARVGTTASQLLGVGVGRRRSSWFRGRSKVHVDRFSPGRIRDGSRVDPGWNRGVDGVESGPAGGSTRSLSGLVLGSMGALRAGLRAEFRAAPRAGRPWPAERPREREREQTPPAPPDAHPARAATFGENNLFLTP